MRPTGHLQVKGPAGRRRWYALWRDADGRHQKVLAAAWVRDSGRRTSRGAIIWRAADGPKPSDAFLTPKEAAAALEELLAAAPRAPQRTLPSEPVRTFGEACSEWLRYVEHDKERSPSTLLDYRNSVRRYLLPHFGADTPLVRITTEDIEDFRDRMLQQRKLSRRTVQKLQVILHGIFKRAKRKKWIASNPAEDAERIALKRSGDFSVLSPPEVEALARAAEAQQDAAIFVVAAYTGLRLGELRGLRWRDVDFGKHLIHVRRNLPAHGGERPPKSGLVRSVPLVDRAAVALDGLSQREYFTSGDDFVFPNAIGGPLDDGRLRHRFHAARKRAGLKPLRFHDLRHTFGTIAVRAFPLTDVKAYMGHADIQTTMLYVHHVPQLDAANRLAAVLAAETGELLSGAPVSAAS